MFKIFQKLSLMLCAMAMAGAPALAADELTGQPYDWGFGLQKPASPMAQRIYEFHDFMLWIIIAISIFVLALLVWVIARYNKHVNKMPSNVSHNVLLEVVWTVVPVLILVVISIKSLPLLYYVDRTENPDMTIKVTGYQWYWGYDYPDHEGLNFLAYPVADADIDPSKGQVRNLSTDVPVIVPVDQNIQILTTAGDVIHSWTVPALGVKMDTVPGRLNETWVRVTKPGVYYGQCSELCGKDHAFMPIELHAVSQEEFDIWVTRSIEAGEPAPSPLRVTYNIPKDLSRFAQNTQFSEGE